MSISGILLGLINIAIVVVVLLLIGVLIRWFLNWLRVDVPDMAERLYVAIVVLVALYMLVALLFGIPSFYIIGSPRVGWLEHLNGRMET